MIIMSYTPRHGGGQKKTDSRVELTANRRAERHSASDNKGKSKAIVISLLVVFSAAIIVALFFLLKPAVAPESTSAATDYSTESATIAAYSGSYTSPNSVLQYSGGEIPTSGSRHDVTVAPDGGADAMEIIGTWYVDEWTAYIFDGYGRGVMLASNNNYTFAYSAQNGQLVVDYDDDKGMDTEYTYILSGDNLTLKRGNSEYKLTKEIVHEQTQTPTQTQPEEQTQGQQ